MLRKWWAYLWICGGEAYTREELIGGEIGYQGRATVLSAYSPATNGKEALLDRFLRNNFDTFTSTEYELLCHARRCNYHGLGSGKLLKFPNF